MKSYRYSEIFRSIQGEGKYSGVPTLWLRLWGCNFKCQGFSQDNPQVPSSYKDPFEGLDISAFKSMEDLPVIKYGCDSIYSWHPSFRHLSHQGTAEQICNQLESLLPDGKFDTSFHMAFTGGEPIMSQNGILEILHEFEGRDNVPSFITIETNGTQEVRSELSDWIKQYEGQWFWSVSPKLSASGEKWGEAVRPGNVAAYQKLSNAGQLKFVVDGTQKSWDEVADAAAAFRDKGNNWEICIMPCGATQEQQEDIQATLCEQTIDRGYRFSPRIHNWLWGNKVGT
jgi:7-carboxy-7-deazaguanine synthase